VVGAGIYEFSPVGTAEGGLHGGQFSGVPPALSLKMALRMALLVLLVAALQAATEPTPEPPLKKFAGDAACLSCHRDQGTSYLHTSHHLTSQPANKDSILGSFHEGSNVLMIADPATATDNPALYFKMKPSCWPWKYSGSRPHNGTVEWNTLCSSQL